jgi:hypothetical protein
MAEERMIHPPVRLNAAMLKAVIDSVADCASQSDWQIVAASIESTHTLICYSPSRFATSTTR